MKKETVTTWWNIEDSDAHVGRQARGSEYTWCHMSTPEELKKEKRFHEPEYDTNNGRVKSFWLELEMPKYLWHLYEAGMPEANDKWSCDTYDFSKRIIDDWVETQRTIHWSKNPKFYYDEDKVEGFGHHVVKEIYS